MHLYPTIGNSINVASVRLDFLYPKGSPYSIPISLRQRKKSRDYNFSWLFLLITNDGDIAFIDKIGYNNITENDYHYDFVQRVGGKSWILQL